MAFRFSTGTVCTGMTADRVVGLIGQETTPEEFDQLVISYKDLDGKNCIYTLAMGRAAQVHNSKLIEYIIKLGGKVLLNLKDCFDRTPLSSAVSLRADYPSSYTVVKKLIDLGADVEKVSFKKTMNLALAKLLMRRGAKDLITLFPKGYREIQEERAKMYTFILCNNRFGRLPVELLMKINDYFIEISSRCHFF